MIRRRLPGRPVTTATLYFCLVPVTGLAGTVALIITDYLYLWPVLILPLVLALLPLPGSWLRWVAPVAAIALIAVGLGTGAVPNLGRVSTYFAYRSPETRCLDAKLPAGMLVGYSTFSGRAAARAHVVAGLSPHPTQEQRGAGPTGSPTAIMPATTSVAFSISTTTGTSRRSA
ncbi:MAG: hypothetical protein WDM88_04290 [Galbitalea sp.]